MMKANILITGAGGCFGYALGNLISESAISHHLIACTRRNIPIPWTDDVRVGNLCNKNWVRELIQQNKPKFIFHMASIFGSDHIEDLIHNNTMPLTYILETIKEESPETILITIGSASEYGAIAEEKQPITENEICAPVVPYALSKLLATNIAQYYAHKENLNVMIVRPFPIDWATPIFSISPRHVFKTFTRSQTQFRIYFTHWPSSCDARLY